MQWAKTEGQTMGKHENTQALQQAKSIQTKELQPENAKPFEAKEAKQALEENAQASSEIVQFLTSEQVRRNERDNKHFQENELFLKQSEEMDQQANVNAQHTNHEKKDYSLHTCQQAGDPLLLVIERTLQVHFQQSPAIKETNCLGHKEIKQVKKKGDFEKSIKKLRRQFEKDETILTYQIDLLQIKPTFYIVLVTWKHQVNATNCDHFEEKIIQEERAQEVGEGWVYDNPDLWALANGPDCTLIEQVCLDAASKTLHGKQMAKQCWKERLSFLYQFPSTHECEALKSKFCTQISQRCLQDSPFGCALWEFTFQCFDEVHKQFVSVDVNDLYGFKEYMQEASFSPNRSFAQVAAKLAVFDEAKKEIEKAESLDASTLEIFQGERFMCSKSVADHLLYDCCFRYAGLAKQMGLSKCTADEVSLADRREQGLCHYVGSYEEKVLGLWKSRDEHVFCCYPSKLARLVQEEGRKQLGMSWGTPEHPQCGELSFDLLAKLDFTQMDLKELCDQMPQKLPDDFQDKMQTFQQRLQEQIEKENIKEREKV